MRPSNWGTNLIYNKRDPSLINSNSPIGVFDSGMGGLTVLAELHKRLPGENFIYLGDTARVPYGSRSARTVQRYSQEAARFLLQFDIKMMVIACNTATAHARPLLESILPIPVVGVIEPGVDALLSATKNRRVGVIGTRATVKSDRYGETIREKQPGIQVFSKACPLFVPLVEEGWINKKVASMVIQEYLSELVREDVDTIVLGCTHYPLLKGTINEEFPHLNLIDSSVEVALRVEQELTHRSLLSDRKDRGTVRIMLTDVTDQMERLETLFFGMPFQAVEEVVLED